MSSTGRILILTSCTARKFSNDPARPVAAEDLYAGQQHVRLMRGVRAYRQAGEPHGSLHLQVLSAQHGLIDAATPLTTYDTTFSGLRRSEVRRRGACLGIPEDAATLLAERWDLVVLLLGDLYLHAAAISEDVILGGPVLALTSPNSGARLPGVRGLTILPLHNQEARRFSCGLTALKGELAGRLLGALVETPVSAIPREPQPLLDWFAALPQPAVDSDQLALAA
jgi:hypothetical protein